MMETLIALIIALVVLAGVFVLVQMAFSSNTISEAQQNLTTTKANLSRVFANQSDYEALGDNGNQIATQSGIVPSSMIVGDTSSGDITNAFGGDVTIASDNGDGAGLAAAAGLTTKSENKAYYSITYDGAPQEACIQLASYTRSQWVGGIDVNGTAIDVFTDGKDPVVAQVNAACTNTPNTLIFIHR